MSEVENLIALELDLKNLLISSLDLEDLTADDIDSEEAFFTDGLGLDSIDALEIGMAIQKQYSVKIDAQDQDVKLHFASIRNLAAFVSRSQKESAHADA